MKLIKLTTREQSGEQPLNGVYHVTIDLHATADKQITLEALQRKVSEMVEVEDLCIEKYADAETLFNVGDTIELVEDLKCEKTVYLDTSGSLVISDSPAVGCVEKVGEFSINLPRGIVAEINQKPTDGSVDILFSAEAINIEDLEKVAYLGILTLPCESISKVI